MKSLRAADSLAGALEDPVHLVSQNAASALGMLGTPVVGLLLAQIQESASADLQQRYSEALARLRDPEAVDMLAAAVNYLEPPARYGAAEALGALGIPEAVPALVQTLDSDDPVSRQKAAQALFEIGTAEACAALTVLLADHDPRLRELAVRGLGLAGGEQAVLSILTHLDDPEETVRLAAASALAGLREPQAEPVLLTALRSPSSFAQQAVAHALRAYPGVEVAGRLVALMTEEGDLRVRLTAAQSLARLGDRRGTAMILRTLNAPNQETRRMAAIALGMAGDPRAADPLLDSIMRGIPDAASVEGRRQRRRMLDAIESVGAPMALPLIGLLSSGDPGVSGFATDALARLGREAVEPLIQALESNPQMSVRVAAARLLGRLGDQDAVEPLMQVLRGSLLGPYPLVFFLRLISDRTAPLRAAAAAALGEIGTLDGAALLLSSARYDPSPEVNTAAEAALARAGAPAVIVRLAQPDVGGFINRALASGLSLLLAGGLAGAATRLWGASDAVLLAGLAAAGMIGLADGLEGRRRTIRLGLAGCLAGAAAAWLCALAGLPAMAGSAAAAVFPAAAALAGWSRAEPAQRLAGLFGGVLLGFIGAGAGGLILSTIGS